MCKICPKCGAIAEYNAYYERITCTRCNWESEKRKIIDRRELYYVCSIKSLISSKQVQVTTN